MSKSSAGYVESLLNGVVNTAAADGDDNLPFLTFNGKGYLAVNEDDDENSVVSQVI